MLPYGDNLKRSSRSLRRRMTEAELAIWSRVRLKQLEGIQFYRQKPIAGYIVDFYAPAAKLVVEVDGSQHQKLTSRKQDLDRTSNLNGLGLKVLRFDNAQVLTEIEGVIETIVTHLLKYGK